MQSVEAFVSSPVGVLRLLATDDAVLGIGWPEAPASAPRVGAPIEHGLLAEAAQQLDDYFHGRRLTFDLPLQLRGTPFQERVWRALLDIPLGDTWSYGQLARTLGKPGASRAVGLANGRNPIAIVVPCHRVIGSDGSLTGYGGGMPNKRWLLAHEASLAGHAPRQAPLWLPDPVG